MKKALSILLALVMCLSLCACAGDVPNDTATESTTETVTENNAETTDTQTEATEDNAEKQAKYDYALAQLEASTSNYTDHSALVKEVYDILSELDGYKDSDKYLKQITIIQDVCICVESFRPNSFGEKMNLLQSPRGYDAQARMSWSMLEGGRFIYLYSYDAQNRISTLTEKDTQDNTTVYIQTYQYDNEGRLSTITTEYGDGDSFVYTYEYNSVGQCIKYQETKSYDEFKYDETGRKTEMVRSFVDFSDKYVEKYYYNDLGEMIKSVGDDIRQNDNGNTSQQNKLFVNEYIYSDGRMVTHKTYSTYNLDDPTSYQDCKEYNYMYGDYYCYTPAE